MEITWAGRRGLGAAGRGSLLATFAACAALLPPIASAQTIPAVKVSPVNIHLAPGERSAVLTLENPGDLPVIFQIRPFLWTQPDGAEKLEPTDALMVSPPFATVPEHGAQVVRLILRRPPQIGEAAYRILLDQIPPPAAPGGVNVVLRISIPVFADSSPPVRATLRWTLQDDAGGTYLLAVNQSGRHEVLRNVKLTSASGQALRLRAAGTPYLLAGSTRRWRVEPQDAAAATGPLRISAESDAGPIVQMIQLGHGAP